MDHARTMADLEEEANALIKQAKIEAAFGKVRRENELREAYMSIHGLHNDLERLLARCQTWEDTKGGVHQNNHENILANCRHHRISLQSPAYHTTNEHRRSTEAPNEIPSFNQKESRTSLRMRRTQVASH